MSTDDFKLNAQARDDQGKGASRRLRRENLVPAIVYGGKKDPQNIAISHNELTKHLENEAFYSHIIALDVAGKSEDVILKDLQRHPAKAQVLHADFLRVDKNQKLTTRVPLHFLNEDSCKGVKLQGGIISHSVTDLEISCLPQDLPEYIEVDLKDVVVGDIIHISDLKLPNGVESVALSHGEEHNQPVATVTKAKGATDDEGDTEQGEAGGDE